MWEGILILYRNINVHSTTHDAAVREILERKSMDIATKHFVCITEPFCAAQTPSHMEISSEGQQKSFLFQSQEFLKNLEHNFIAKVILFLCTYT
jgi:hypothetical protein